MQVLEPPCCSWWTKSRTKRWIDSCDVVVALPSPPALARRCRVRFAPLFTEGGAYIPGNPFCSCSLLICLCSVLHCREVLVALDRIISSSKKPFLYESWLRCGFGLNASQLPLKQKANPLFTSHSAHCCVFRVWWQNSPNYRCLRCWVWTCKWPRAKAAARRAALMHIRWYIADRGQSLSSFLWFWWQFWLLIVP